MGNDKVSFFYSQRLTPIHHWL